MTTRQVERTFRPIRPLPVPPVGFTGSYPEYLCHRELQRQDYVPGLDFFFQSNVMGGRLSLGGLVVDFVFHRPPLLAIEVNGRYYHHDRPGIEQDAQDIYKREQMTSLNYHLVYIDDIDLIEDAGYYVSEALAFRDHSELRL